VIGYWLGREHWGRGIATDALREFLELVDERPLQATVAHANHASVRVLEKNGFRLLRVEPEELVFQLE
jgi:RimJ/RimL family protein N-acetyltransferase